LKFSDGARISPFKTSRISNREWVPRVPLFFVAWDEPGEG
jgi:hypothetical protein